jgi:hypothetical protein
MHCLCIAAASRDRPENAASAADRAQASRDEGDGFDDDRGRVKTENAVITICCGVGGAWTGRRG